MVLAHRSGASRHVRVLSSLARSCGKIFHSWIRGLIAGADGSESGEPKLRKGRGGGGAFRVWLAHQYVFCCSLHVTAPSRSNVKVHRRNVQSQSVANLQCGKRHTLGILHAVQGYWTYAADKGKPGCAPRIPGVERAGFPHPLWRILVWVCGLWFMVCGLWSEVYWEEGNSTVQ